MNLPDGLLGDEWTALTWLLFLPLLVLSVWRSPWRLLGDSAHLNVWLGCIVTLTLLWSLQAGVKPGLSLHLLGASVLTLAFGPWLAFLALCLVLAGVTLNGAAGWEGYAANALLMCGVGSLAAHAVLRFSERCLPRHFFVYIFANGFFGAAISVAAVGSVASLLFALSGTYAADYLLTEYLPYILLLSFSEAWLSGMVLTLFVVYRPDWVATFEDAHYLRD